MNEKLRATTVTRHNEVARQKDKGGQKPTPHDTALNNDGEKTNEAKNTYMNEITMTQLYSKRKASHSLATTNCQVNPASQSRT